MEIQPLRPVCKRKEKHFGTKPIYDPDFDGSEWREIDQKDWGDRASYAEHAFPVYPGQFEDIIHHLTPSEVWTRMGAEIRFVWNSQSSREILEFIQPTYAKRFPRRIEFMFTSEIEGRVAIHLHDITDNLVVRPRVSDEDFADQPPFKRPPTLLFYQEELRHAHDIHVLMAVMRRGYGPTSVKCSKFINSVWVG